MNWIGIVFLTLAYIGVGSSGLKSVWKFFLWCIGNRQEEPDTFETFFIIIFWPLLIFSGVTALIIRGFWLPIHLFISFIREFHYGD